MAVSSRQNQNMMNLIRKVHGLVERPDLTKHRQSQDRIGAILGTEKGIAYEETEVDGMSCEWVKVERAHLKRYVILYCHGGGYSTGSTVYARTLTTKLAESTGMDVFCFNYRLAPECKFPAAAEDAMKAWNYLMYLGYGARDVIVAGDSAGGCVFFRGAHETFCIYGVVETPVGRCGNSYTGFEHRRSFAHTHQCHVSAIAPSPDTDPVFIHIRLFA